jgi:hypothetical protein
MDESLSLSAYFMSFVTLLLGILVLCVMIGGVVFVCWFVLMVVHEGILTPVAR